ncbi:cytochrome c oxidase subunit II [Desulfoluna sp.]|uniref:cytochrome c oxidase subunit II n=1 Tax=Desulfoluna sp. TaxID=2045199 RepID=UPI00261D3D25|nr:cytochrome c oxidase subunit II [Desulfoluna sp.]
MPMENNPVELVDRAFYFILGFSFLFLFAITAVMIWFVIRYRRSRNPVPSDVRGNVWLEIAWTVIPTLIALAMFVSGWQAYTGLRTVPDGAMEIKVYAQMFSWIFVYPNDKETENELVVPVGTPIKITLTSEDVLHSFYLPSFRVKIDAVKGMTTYAWFYPDKVGDFVFHCTEFCGTGHSSMDGALHIVSVDAYETFLEEEVDE